MPDFSDYPEDLRPYLEELTSQIDALMARYRDGELDLPAWRDEFALLLTGFVAGAYLLASGAEDIIGDALVWVTGWIATQLDYLNGFEDAIGVSVAAGGEYSPAWDARARMYAGSVVAPYWYGATEMLPLPALAGDMSSDCGQWDACGWEIDWIDQEKGDADCYWRLNYTRIVKTEHCQQCTERSIQWNPLRVRGWRLVVPEINKESAHAALPA